MNHQQPAVQPDAETPEQTAFFDAADRLERLSRIGSHISDEEWEAVHRLGVIAFPGIARAHSACECGECLKVRA